MIGRIVAALTFVLMPAAVALADVQSEVDLEIVIGRTEVMQDQTARGLVVLGVQQASPDGEQLLPGDPQRDQFSRLSEAVVRHNTLRDMACGSRVIQHPLCFGARYAPAWFASGRRVYLRQDDLKRMAEEVQGQTMPLWLAVCDRARQRSGDRNFCAIE